MFDCPSASENSVPNRRIFIKFDIQVFFENLSWKCEHVWPFKDEAQTALFKDPVRTAL